MSKLCVLALIAVLFLGAADESFWNQGLRSG
jgi:hypothetical protein